ncbi:MAG: response regulator transcription factor [Leptospiraceae bacterium]|nr:response regulator transcription factor [Leptospiraceae bacterium]
MHVLIVDDEPPAARRVERLLREIESDSIQSLKIFHSIEPAVYYLQEHPVDLLFLDLQLAGDSGFDLLRQSRSDGFHTIIVSGYPEGALEAFEHEVVDFVPKPIRPERFAQALNRLRTARNRGAGRKSLTMPGDESIEIIPLKDIEAVTSDGNYCVVETAENSQRVRKTLTSLEAELGPDFFRCHKTCLVRKSEMLRILKAPNNTFQLEMKSGKKMPLGRSAREQLRSGDFGVV